MKSKKNISSKRALRKKALEMISKNPSQIKKMPAKDIENIIEELQIHQIELELQNEELRQAQVELENERDKYTDLYDFAPVGYFSIDNNGIIREANLTVSFLLGTERQSLIGRKFTSFIFKDDQDIFYLHTKNIEEKQSSKNCELRIHKKSGELFWAKLDTATKKGNNNHTFFRVALTDISERFELQQSIKQSGLNWKKTFDTIKDGICLLDRDQKIQQYNAEFIKIVNKNDAEIINHHCWEVVHDTTKPIHGCPIEKMKKSLVREKTEIQLKDRWFEIDVDPIFDNDGTLIGAVHIMRDISEEKEAELKLSHSEKLNRDILSSISDAVYVTDEKGNFTFVSQNVDVIFGYSKPEVEQMGNIKNLLGKSFYKKSELSKLGEIENIERSIVDKNGAIHHLLINVKKVDLGKGRVLITCRDVTERKHVLEELVKSEKLLKLAERTAHLGYYEIDTKTGEAKWSIETYRIFGLDPARWTPTNENYRKLIHPEDVDKLFEMYEDCIKKKSTFDLVYRIYHANGTIRYVKSIGRMETVNNSANIMFGTIQDITNQKMLEFKMEASEEKFRTLFESADVAMGMIDDKGKFILINKAAKKFLKLKSENLKEINFMSVTYAPDLHESLKRFKQCLKDKKPYTIEKRYITTSKQIKWGLTTVTPVFDTSGKFKYAIAHLNDISERKQAEKEIRFQAHLLNVVGQSVIATDLEGRIIYWNRFAETLYGWPAAEALGQNVMDVNVSDTTKDQAAEIMASLQAGESWAGEFVVQHRSGRTFPVFVTNTPIQDENGQLAGFIGISSDITERKKAEEVLQKEKNTAQNYLNIAGSMILALDAEGKVTLINKKGCEILGYTEEEVIGKDWIQTFLPEKMRKDVSIVFNQLISGKIKDLENVSNLSIITKDGKEKSILWHNSIITNEEGDIVGTLSSGEDVTERKLAEQKLKESEVKYRSVFENTGTTMFIIEGDMTISLANEEVKESLGYSRQEVEGRKWIEFVHPEDLERMKKQHSLRRSDPGKALKQYGVRIFDKAGSIRHVIVIIDMIPDTNKSIVSLVDITKRKQAEEKILESKKMIEGIINTAPIRIFWKDKNLKYLGCNNIFARDAGYDSPEDIIGKDDYQIGWADQADIYRKDDMSVLNSGKPKYMIEEPQTTPEGKTITLLTSKIPLKNSQGEIYGVLGTYLDITKRIEAENALKKSELLNRSLLKNATAGIGFYDKQGRVILFNDQALRSIGGTSDQYVGKSLIEIFGQKNGALYLKRLKEAIKTGHPLTFEDCVTLNNQQKWLISHYSEVKDNNDELLGVMVISHDITEQKNIQSELKKITQALEEAQDLAVMGSWDWNLKTNKAWWSDGLYKIYGLDKKRGVPKVKNDDWLKLVHPQDRKKVENIVANAITEKSTFHIESRIIRQNDKKIRILSILGKIVCDKEGNAERLVGTVQDITEKKELENQLKLNESKLTNIFKTINEGVIYLDHKGNILNINHALTEISEMPEEKLIGKNIIDIAKKIVSKNEFIKLSKIFNKILSCKSLPTFELEINNKILEISTVFDKEIKNITGVIRDVTSAKQYKIELESSYKQMRKLTANLQDAREEERLTIAREIHDDLGQALTALKIDMVNYSNQSLKDMPQIGLKIDNYVNYVDSVIKSVKRITSDLRPSLLEDLGLAAAVEWLVEDLQKRTKINIKLEIEPEDINLESNIAIQVYRIIQEGLTNIVRHAEATKANIKIIQKETELCLTISDNGIGLKLSQLKDKKSFGLLGMQERVLAIAGEFDLKVNDESPGTKITIRIPDKI